MIIFNKNELGGVLELINRSDIIAFDTETTSVNTRKAIPIGLSIANEIGEAAYVVIREYKDGALMQHILDSDITPLLKLLQHKRLVMHNAAYDCQVVKNFYNVDLIEALHCDTMLQAHIIDENKFSYGLKQLGAEVFGESAKDEQVRMKESIKANGGANGEIYKANVQLIAEYGRQDAILTINLYQHYDKLMDVQTRKFFYEDETIPLLKYVTIPMISKGVKLDLELIQQSKLEIEKDLAELEQSIQEQIRPYLSDFNQWYLEKGFPVSTSGEFFDTYMQLRAPEGWPRTKAGGFTFTDVALKKFPELKEHRCYKLKNAKERFTDDEIVQVRKHLFEQSGVKYMFNLLSKHHLKKLLFETLEESAVSYTDKGSPQVDDALLDVLADKYEWVAQLRTFNKLTKIHGTYINGYLEKQEDGIFYPQFQQHRTVSGRYSSDFQQLPRPLEPGQAEGLVIKYTNRIRCFFIADEGSVIISTDYEALEPRVFAHVANDEGLKDIFRKNYDFYSSIAIPTEGLHEYSADKKAPNYLGKLNKQKRQAAKAYALGVPYRMGAYALSMTLKDSGMDISDKEAQVLIDKYLNAFPNLKKWMADTEKFVKENGYIVTQAGRVRHFPELLPLLEKYKNVDMTNSLEIYKAYNELPKIYEQAKQDGRTIRNILANSCNFQIQSLGASIVNRASIEIAKRIKDIDGAYFQNQVHDETIITCKIEDIQKVEEIIQDAMENTYKISVKLNAVPSHGKNFNEAKG